MDNCAIDHVFRHNYGLLLSSLAKRIGAQHLDIIEDAMQFSMIQALEHWIRQGHPRSPAAWLYRVAHRKCLDELRAHKRQQERLFLEHSPNIALPEADVPLPGEMSDAFLKMLFVACEDAIPIESQLVFTLKSLCGFSIDEIAYRLFITTDNAYKRLSRARTYLSKHFVSFDDLHPTNISVRLAQVHKVIYLIFTEG